MTLEQSAHFRHAIVFFDEMRRHHPKRCARVTHTFDRLRTAPGAPSIYDCFLAAVNDELATIECEVLLALVRPIKGTA